MRVIINWYDTDRAFLSASNVFDDELTAANTWELHGGIATAPASTAYFTIAVLKHNAAFNAWCDSMFAERFPVCFLAYRGSAQTISSGAYATIEFDSEAYDHGSIYDNASNYRFTVPTTGIYSMTASVFWSTAAADGQEIRIKFYLDGSTDICETIYTTGAASAIRTTAIVPARLMTAGEYYVVRVYHNKGSDMNTTGAAGADSYTFFTATKIG
jgi:hypothetical protein